MKFKKIEDIKIWSLSIEFASNIYKITSKEAFKYDFSLKDQLRRASVSVGSNIAEGFERDSDKEFIKFLRIAKGSLLEVKTQLLIAIKINYISIEEYNNIELDINLLSNSIGKLLIHLRSSL